MVVTKQISNSSHCMTRETMEVFVKHEVANGASDNMIRRLKGTLKVIYEYLPNDKVITKERLASWRESMEKQGYASATITNYVKYVNRYLRYVGCEKLQLQRNSSKNLKGMTFGYLTALEIVGQDERKNNIWLCECKCKKTIEVVATLLINGNTRSCGCLYGEHLSKANKNIDHTNLRQALKDEIVNKENKSGYVGVAPKRDKWQAYITYKGTRYNLGVYADIKDAVKARMRAKQLVMEDAEELLKYYEEVHRDDLVLPSKDELPMVDYSIQPQKINDTIESIALRSDNTSGYKGVSFINKQWEARICYKGVRYILGSFKEREEAVDARKKAEKLLKRDVEQFVEYYSKTCRHHKTK